MIEANLLGAITVTEAFLDQLRDVDVDLWMCRPQVA